MNFLKKRICTPELMDNPALPLAELKLALKGLKRLTKISGSAYYLSQSIFQIVKKHPKNIRLLDLGCGDGEVFCKIVRSLIQRGILVSAIGTDINSNSLIRARDYAKQLNLPIEFIQSAALEALNLNDYDLVTSSLFLHHLEEQQLVNVFEKIKEKSKLGFVMNDLERTIPGYFLIKLATHLLSLSKIVRYDGQQSVRAALTSTEFKNLLKALPGAKIKRAFPCSLILSWER